GGARDRGRAPPLPGARLARAPPAADRGLAPPAPARRRRERTRRAAVHRARRPRRARGDAGARPSPRGPRVVERQPPGRARPPRVPAAAVVDRRAGGRARVRARQPRRPRRERGREPLQAGARHARLNLPDPLARRASRDARGAPRGRRAARGAPRAGRAPRVRIATLSNAAVGHTRRWVEHFRSRGHEVGLWSLEPAPAALPCFALPRAPLPGWLRYPLALPALQNALAAFEPDLVDAHYVPNYGLL